MFTHCEAMSCAFKIVLLHCKQVCGALQSCSEDLTGCSVVNGQSTKVTLNCVEKIGVMSELNVSHPPGYDADTGFTPLLLASHQTNMAASAHTAARGALPPDWSSPMLLLLSWPTNYF